MPRIPKSRYLDLTSWRSLPDKRPNLLEAYDLDRSDYQRYDGDPVVVAVTLPRANDPSDLLALEWGERQAVLAELERSGELWELYGADPQEYARTEARLEALGGRILGREDGVFGSPETRTIWVELDAQAFHAAFGRRLQVVREDGQEVVFWRGALRTDGFEVDGFYTQVVGPATPDNLAEERSVTLPEVFSPGNGLGFAEGAQLYPNEIAALYDFPLSGGGEGTIGLLQPGIGSALPPGSDFDRLLGSYLEDAGAGGVPDVYTRNARFQTYDEDAADERSLDVSIAAAVNPDAAIGLYVGGPDGSVFSAFYDAIWDDRRDPEVIATSFSDLAAPAPGSPLANAYDELFVDAALARRSVLIAPSDGGSANQVDNGLVNVGLDSSPYTIQVGGTSVSSRAAARADETLSDLVAPAFAHDLDTLWELVAGGLTELPRRMADDEFFAETAWNEYGLFEDVPDTPLEGVDFAVNSTTGGGVQTRFEIPDYQTGLGLLPEAPGPRGGPGRGLPDVTANAGGNLFYKVLSPDFREEDASGGTSASTPLWASLTLQLNDVLEAAGLPRLGYFNDLLYQAAALAPAAFNDVTIGNNVSSFGAGSRYALLESGEGGLSFGGDVINATGLGYAAREGFDLVSGLGSPHGDILAETLLAAATGAAFFDLPPVVELSGRRAESGADQTVLVQSRFESASEAILAVDGERAVFSSPASDAFAFTDRFARQILEEDFSARLVRRFDGQSQGQLLEIPLREGERLALRAIDGERFETDRAAVTADFGFASFDHPAGAGEVTLARPVAIATTPEAASGMPVGVSLRQATRKDVSVQFFEVDDLTGAIGDLSPGDKGYGRAAARRAYETVDGEQWIDGAGHGRFRETDLSDVDAGDVVAMRIRARGETYYPFAEANDGDARLWSYGLNVWGWEIGGPRGDRDYNDLVVGLDFGASVTDDLFV